jgi:hypothetical protein
VRPLALVSILAALAAFPVAAQVPVESMRLTGMTMDYWRGAGPALLRPTLRLTTHPGRGLGTDFALTIFPDAISIAPPAVALGLQAAVAHPVPLGSAVLLPKAGAAGIVATGVHDHGAFLGLVPGLQAGLGLLVPLDRKSALRLDLTRHVYWSNGYSYPVWSLGFGFAGGLRRKG